jgi:hypothetical protein
LGIGNDLFLPLAGALARDDGETRFRSRIVLPAIGLVLARKAGLTFFPNEPLFLREGRRIAEICREEASCHDLQKH